MDHGIILGQQVVARDHAEARTMGLGQRAGRSFQLGWKHVRGRRIDQIPCQESPGHDTRGIGHVGALDGRETRRLARWRAVPGKGITAQRQCDLCLGRVPAFRQGLHAPVAFGQRHRGRGNVERTVRRTGADQRIDRTVGQNQALARIGLERRPVDMADLGAERFQLGGGDDAGSPRIAVLGRESVGHGPLFCVCLMPARPVPAGLGQSVNAFLTRARDIELSPSGAQRGRPWQRVCPPFFS